MIFLEDKTSGYLLLSNVDQYFLESHLESVRCMQVNGELNYKLIITIPIPFLNKPLQATLISLTAVMSLSGANVLQGQNQY